jgi:hypothetical protein
MHQVGGQALVEIDSPRQADPSVRLAASVAEAGDLGGKNDAVILGSTAIILSSMAVISGSMAVILGSMAVLAPCRCINGLIFG